MPIIFRGKGFIVKMYPKEGGHNIPHVHVFCGGAVAVISFSGDVLVGDLTGKVLKDVRRWLKDNRTVIEERWSEYNG